jgi:hypothetical protein
MVPSVQKCQVETKQAVQTWYTRIVGAALMPSNDRNGLSFTTNSKIRDSDQKHANKKAYIQPDLQTTGRSEEWAPASSRRPSQRQSAYRSGKN